jgi:hypothetical protein
VLASLLYLTLCSQTSLASPLADWHQQGSATMRWLGLKIYDISLWRPPSAPDRAGPFALELKYAMRFRGSDIAARSIEEMQAQGYDNATQLARWQRAMTRIFPDVKPGDRLLGVALPGKEARFYSGDRHLGSIEDPAFVQAFFDIWLSQKTRAPRVRAQLIKGDS